MGAGQIDPTIWKIYAAIVTGLSPGLVPVGRADIALLGNNNIRVPGVGNKIRLYYISLSAPLTNAADVTVLLKFNATELYKVNLAPGAIWARNIGAGLKYIEGAINESFIGNLSAALTVLVSYEYQEL